MKNTHLYICMLQRAIEQPMETIFSLYVRCAQYQKLSVYGRRKEKLSREIWNRSRSSSSSSINKTLLANIQNRDSKNENILQVYVSATDSTERINERMKNKIILYGEKCVWCELPLLLLLAQTRKCTRTHDFFFRRNGTNKLFSWLYENLNANQFSSVFFFSHTFSWIFTFGALPFSSNQRRTVIVPIFVSERWLFSIFGWVFLSTSFLLCFLFFFRFSSSKNASLCFTFLLKL